jgi:hypothetical protein
VPCGIDVAIWHLVVGGGVATFSRPCMQPCRLEVHILV